LRDMESLALSEDESGVAILEWSIVLSATLLLMLTFFDMCLALTQYAMLTNAANEGLRLAQVLPALEPTSPAGLTDLIPTTAQHDACINATFVAFPCQQYLVQLRVQNALQRIEESNSLPLSVDAVSITTFYSTTDDRVGLQVTGNFIGFFLPSIPLRVDTQGAYLYEEL
ncbi:MAG: pilus assembly protein, partial [Bdellovibrionales bacterium]|nr:pilus assembly protein [Bdellovibrionales bacterium]